VHGYATAFWWATAIMLLAALIVAVLVRTDDRGASIPAAGAADANGPTMPVMAH
jgi:hypothetical protein